MWIIWSEGLKYLFTSVHIQPPNSVALSSSATLTAANARPFPFNTCKYSPRATLNRSGITARRQCAGLEVHYNLISQFNHTEPTGISLLGYSGPHNRNVYYYAIIIIIIIAHPEPNCFRINRYQLASNYNRALSTILPVGHTLIARKRYTEIDKLKGRTRVKWTWGLSSNKIIVKWQRGRYAKRTTTSSESWWRTDR